MRRLGSYGSEDSIAHKRSGVNGNAQLQGARRLLPLAGHSDARSKGGLNRCGAGHATPEAGYSVLRPRLAPE